MRKTAEQNITEINMFNTDNRYFMRKSKDHVRKYIKCMW